MNLLIFLKSAVQILIIYSMSPYTADAWTLGDTQTTDAGWIIDDTGEKHFTIGLWGIPDYTFLRTDAEPAKNDSIYQAQTAPFNTIVMQSGYQKQYMKNRGMVFMAGSSSFQWMLSDVGYTGDVTLVTDDRPVTGSTIHFERMHSILEHIEDLRSYLTDSVYPFITAGYEGEKFIHFIIDEPDTGNRGWFWPPAVIRAYHETVHELEPDGLTFIDFGGTISGNRYFYAQRFGETFRTGTDPERGECNPELMNTYVYAYDGSPLYRYEKLPLLPGRWVRRPPSDFSHLFYENVYRTAMAYRGCSDIVGFNSYFPFRDFPESAGETVDALKAALGEDTPVWLFFDGYGGVRNSDMSWSEYAKLVTCQVYTSIIHGATGAMFFSAEMSGEAKQKYWPLVRELAIRIGTDCEAFKLPEISRSWDKTYHTDGYSHIHYSIRGDSKRRCLIVSNTDRKSSHSVEVPGFEQFELEPLGVYVLVRNLE